MKNDKFTILYIICHTIMALVLFFMASYFVLNSVHWGWIVTFLLIGHANASNISNIIRHKLEDDDDNY
jgi:hypothetical protein